MEFRNLLPANAAAGTDINANTAGFAAVYSTISSSTDTFYEGSRSLKVVTNNANNSEGAIHDFVPLVAGNTYTIQMRIKGSIGTIVPKMYFYDSAKGYLNYQIGTTITLNGNWIFVTFTFTAPTNTAYGRGGAATITTIQGLTFYLDYLQLETGSVATNWMPGNLLTYNQQTIETNVTDMNSSSNSTLSRDTTVYKSGTASAKAVLTAASGSVGIRLSSSYYAPIIANKTYLGVVSGRCSKSVSSSYIVLQWYDSAKVFLSQTTISTTSASTTWKTVSTVGNAPANAVWCRLIFTCDNLVTNDAVWWDDAWLIDYTPFLLGGISSQQSVNNATLKSNVLPNGVPTGQSINNVALRFSLNPNGIGSVANIQNLILHGKLNPMNIPSSEFVNDLLLRSNINPNSIPSLETVSDLVLNNILLPLGIISEETINNLTLNNTLELLGIISEETLGNPLLLQNLILEAIETTETINDAIIYVYYEFMELLIMAKAPSSEIQITNPSMDIVTRNPSSKIEVKKW